MEIIIVVIIIAVIMFLFGGGGPWLMIPTDNYQAMKLPESWHCEKVVWEQEPVMDYGVFKGKAYLDCELSGMRGEGISGFQKFVEKEIVENADELHKPPVKQVAGGVSTSLYDLSLKLRAENEEVRSRGNSAVVSDGESFIESKYDSDKFQSQGYGKYIRRLSSQMRVEQLREGNYKLRVTNTLEVKKPWYIFFPSQFRKILKSEYEKEMKAHQENFVKAVANNL